MKRPAALGLFVLALTLGACSRVDNTGQAEKAGNNNAKAVTSRRVELVFGGPWSFAMDSANNRIVAIAPDVLGHSSLYLRAAGSLIEAGGVYDVKLTNGSSGPAGAIPNLVPENITSSTLTNLETGYSGAPYIINLPPTNSIHVFYSDPLSHSDHFPVPKPAVSPMFVTKVVFEYTAYNADIELVRHTDASNTTSESLSSDGIIDVAIDDDPDYLDCDYEAKGTFAEMAKLIGVKRYVDYPDYDPSCYANDPQKPNHIGGMRHPTSAISKGIQADMQRILQNLTSYLDKLKSGPNRENEQILKIQGSVTQIKHTIQSWPLTSEQKRDFVAELKDLVSTTSKSSLPDDVRSHILVLADNLKPYSVSGKNCKAALMLLTVTP